MKVNVCFWVNTLLLIAVGNVYVTEQMTVRSMISTISTVDLKEIVNNAARLISCGIELFLLSRHKTKDLCLLLNHR